MKSPRTRGKALLLSLAILLLATPAALAGAAPGDDWEGPLVLSVNGKDVTLKVSSSSYDVEEEDEPAGFSMDSTTFILAGDFDLNGDGKADAKDRPKTDRDGRVRPAVLLNKPVLLSPTEEDNASIQNYVELPGLGRCAVLKGSTLTVTKYKKTGREVDRWSGTVSLKLKPEKGSGALDVKGRFECGIRAE
jgi:hypothetical protein